MQRKIIYSCQDGKGLMKQITITFLFIGLFFCACKKSHDKTGLVNIRIKNSTNLFLEDVRVGDAAYGLVRARAVTGYVVVTTPVYAGYCNFRVNNQVSGAGYGVCGTPPPPAFPAGYYTFKVEPGTQGYFTLVVTKD